MASWPVWISKYSTKSAASGYATAALCSLTVLNQIACSTAPTLNESLTTPKLINKTSHVSSIATSSTNTDAIKLDELQKIEAHFAKNPLILGNKLSLLYDGPRTMAAMTTAILAAKHSINLETYIFDQDALGMAFAEMLIQRQKEHIAVKIIYDSVGTIGTPQAFFDHMREAGIELIPFNPINPITTIIEEIPWDPNHRDHRKIVVVDGRIAFVGGINISATYSNSSLFRSKKRKDNLIGWRDTHLQIEGPAVAAIQHVFLNSWEHNPSSLAAYLTQSAYFPTLPHSGTESVRVLASDPHANQDIYMAYLNAIKQAQKTIHITCAYFVPDRELLQNLIQAAERGVEVQLILPGLNENDLVSQASQSYFTEMLEHGIHLYQLRESILHAKTAVIDGTWSTVGSANIDTRSFFYNKEINVIVLSASFGKDMEAAFIDDLAASKEVEIGAWQKRAYLQRVKQWLARQLAEWL